jgi:hypothetical protein
LSLGNHPNSRNFWQQIGATLIAAFETVFPVVLVFLWQRRPLADPPTAAQNLVHSEKFASVLYTGLVAGSALTLYYFFSAIKILRADKKMSLTQSSDERGMAMAKRACSQKILSMINSAREMHRHVVQPDAAQSKELSKSKKFDLKTNTDPVFQTYVLHGEGREPCGSLLWVVRSLLSKHLFEEEGIWLPARLWVFQCIQIVVLVIYIILSEVAIGKAVVNAEDATNELPEGLPSWIYGEDMQSLCGEGELNTTSSQLSYFRSFSAMVPSSEDVRIACFPSAIISYIVMAVIILLYIPR